MLGVYLYNAGVFSDESQWPVRWADGCDEPLFSRHSQLKVEGYGVPCRCVDQTAIGKRWLHFMWSRVFISTPADPLRNDKL
jgi:hypothetical protein